jgi:putative FmdB family regulatory protein
MPVYVWQCTKCQELTEKNVTYDELGSTVVFCPEHNEPMKRKYTAPAIQFRGSGFYSTGG